MHAIRIIPEFRSQAEWIATSSVTATAVNDLQKALRDSTWDTPYSLQGQAALLRDIENHKQLGQRGAISGKAACQKFLEAVKKTPHNGSIWVRSLTESLSLAWSMAKAQEDIRLVWWTFPD